ncbi:hypothetical protein B0H13DRAFT_2276916 [Mycena leptocephala]|nr:hypothetical protein B0H13DRAFT_2276916 [Mycena leptocephala]
MYCQILFRKVGWSSVFGCAFHVLFAMSAARNFLVVGAIRCKCHPAGSFRLSVGIFVTRTVITRSYRLHLTLTGAGLWAPDSSIFLANHNHVLGTLVASAFDSTTCCYPGLSSQHLDLKTKSSESQNGAPAASLDYSSPHPVKFAPQLKSFTAAYNLSFAFAKLFNSSRSPRLPNRYSQLRFRCVVAPHDWTLPQCSALVRARQGRTNQYRRYKCCVAPPVIIIFPAFYPPL